MITEARDKMGPLSAWDSEWLQGSELTADSQQALSMKEAQTFESLSLLVNTENPCPSWQTFLKGYREEWLTVRIWSQGPGW